MRPVRHDSVCSDSKQFIFLLKKKKAALLKSSHDWSETSGKRERIYKVISHGITVMRQKKEREKHKLNKNNNYIYVHLSVSSRCVFCWVVESFHLWFKSLSITKILLVLASFLVHSCQTTLESVNCTGSSFSCLDLLTNCFSRISCSAESWQQNNNEMIPVGKSDKFCV